MASVLHKTVFTSPVLKTPKTESSVRKVWLPKTLAHILREWKKAQDELKEYLGDLKATQGGHRSFAD